LTKFSSYQQKDLQYLHKAYNEKWSKYFEGGKDKHYKQDSSYTLAKVCVFGMQIQLTALTEVTTFQQGNRYISGTLLSITSAIKRSIVNWAKWFKVRLHKEMMLADRGRQEK
jgi:hypothetical protein